MRQYIGYILWGGYIAFVALGFIWLNRESARVHGMIDEVEAEANKATTRAELMACLDHAREVSKHCWHRHFSDRLNKVAAIINAKTQMLGTK